MDMAVMDLLMTDNNMTDNNMTIPNIGIVTLPHITPHHMERHNMVIHITQTTHEAATDTKIIRSRVKPAKRGPQNLFLTAVSLRLPHNLG
jgi:hypothetical protein